MIIFRTDRSSLARCAYLAALLRKANDVRLCCREDKQAAKFLAARKIPFSLVKDPAAIALSEAKSLLFDLAAFTAQDVDLLAKAKKTAVKTIQVVPAGAEPQPVDIVTSPASRPEQALLHHKFRHFNKARRKYRKKTGNIFINLGDMLSYRELREVVDVLHRLRFKMRIAPGSGLKKADKRGLMRLFPGVHFCGRSESPARAYFEADLALIPPGEEALEAACVGTPALYLFRDKQHEALAASWIARGLGVKIPSPADFSVQTVRDAVAPLDLETREKMGAAGKKLVDGLGVQRFFKVLKENGIIE
jgi:hypothetical protein